MVDDPRRVHVCRRGRRRSDVFPVGVDERVDVLGTRVRECPAGDDRRPLVDCTVPRRPDPHAGPVELCDGRVLEAALRLPLLLRASPMTRGQRSRLRPASSPPRSSSACSPASSWLPRPCTATPRRRGRFARRYRPFCRAHDTDGRCRREDIDDGDGDDEQRRADVNEGDAGSCSFACRPVSRRRRPA